MNDMQWTAHNSRSPADMAALGKAMAEVLNESQQSETANELIDSGNYTYTPEVSLPETIFMPRTMADRLVARVERQAALLTQCLAALVCAQADYRNDQLIADVKAELARHSMESRS